MPIGREKYANLSELPVISLRTVINRVLALQTASIKLSCNHVFTVKIKLLAQYPIGKEVYCKACGALKESK